MKKLVLSLVTLLSLPVALGQQFSYEISSDITPDNLNFYPPVSATVTSSDARVIIDAANGTAATSGSLNVPSLSWSTSQSEQKTQQITVYNPFPFPDTVTTTTYVDTLNVSYDFVGGLQSLVAAAAVPVHTGLNQYSLGSTPVGDLFEVQFSYTLAENGAVVQSGNGVYDLKGQFAPWNVNVAGYPASLGISGFNATFRPTSATPIITVTPPHGDTMTVAPTGVSPIPEPSSYADAVALALAAFAAARKLSTQRRPGV